MTVTIQKWGNSQGIRIPKHILEELSLKSNDEVEIITENDKIVIRKTKTDRRKSIQELFAGYQGEYTPIEVDFGNPVGKEIW